MTNYLRVLFLTVCVGTLLGMGTFAVEYYGTTGQGVTVEEVAQ